MNPVLLEMESTGSETSIWRSPAMWLREKQLSRDFWVYFTAAFFFDFGFTVYYFLFNLYLLDLHFNERSIGLIGGALTLGSMAGTLPTGLLARKIGLRPLLLVCFVTAPVIGVLRLAVFGEAAQIGLAFACGLAMCLWGVCYLPAVAAATTERNRASAFSLIFSVSIGTAALGGFLCGYLPQWLRRAGFDMQPVQVKRLILISACLIAAIGLLAVLRMRCPAKKEDNTSSGNGIRRRFWQLDPFMLRFLPVMALWTIVLSSFTPFANIYLAGQLHIPLPRIGLIFSLVQVAQFCATLLTPLLFRALGLINGMVVTQLLTAAAIGCLAGTHNIGLAMTLYVGFSALQWMASPGLYNLLMTKMPEEEHSTASALMMFCTALVGAGATASAGILLTRFGYPRVMVGIAALAVAAAVLLRMVMRETGRSAAQA